MSNGLTLTTERIEELKTGEALPQNIGESLFMTAYGEALLGITLKKSYTSIVEEYEAAQRIMTDDDHACFLLGYMEGQEDLQEHDNAINKHLKGHNKKTH